MNKWRSLAILLMCALLCSVGCSRKPDDTAITDSFKAQLFSDAALKSEPIGITVANGEATLTGEVSSNEVKQKVLSMAQVIPGVVKVNDAMQVKGALAEGAPPATELVPTANSTAGASVPPPPAGLAPGTAPAPAASPAVTPPPAAPAPSAAAAVNNAPAPAPAKAPPPPPPQPRKIVVPEGTEVRVITSDAIDSDKSKIGSTFQASLYAPITVGEEVVVPKNANISIKLLDAASAGKVKGKSEIQIGLDSVEVQGKRYPLQSTTYEEAGKSQGKQTAKKVGIGAGVGTAIGAIAGGGKGAAIGAAVGGGAGLATQAFKKGDKLQIPPETKIDFTLEKAVEITLPPKTK
jgi:BON domain/YMGG-like Gly-zipper